MYRIDDWVIYYQFPDAEKLNELGDGSDFDEFLTLEKNSLYVAMTRAKQRLVLGCFNLKERSNSKGSSVDKSAFGRLILGKDKPKISETDWQSALTSKIESLAVLKESLSQLSPLQKPYEF